MDEIQKAYADVAWRRGEMRLYFISDAIRLVEECKKRHIRLSGLDAFLLSGKGIEPSMAHSLWFEANDPDSYQKALEHLSRPENEPYLFEVWHDGY